MSWNQMWSIKEAAMAADILDEMGEFEQASLLDEYIEAATNDELVVQAGLWERFKGWAKTKMFSEYRELVTKAREAQEALEKNMKQFEEDFEKARSDLKNYRLNDWRLALHNLRQKAVDINQLVAGFDQSYGRFLKAVVGVQKLTPEGVAADMSPSEQVEKIFEAAKGTEKSDVSNVVKEDIKSMVQSGLSEWARLDRRHDWYEENPMTGEVRVKAEKVPQLQTHIRPVKIDDKVVYTINRDAKGKVAPWVETFMGDKFWEKTNQDDEWVYFRVAEIPKEAPAEQQTPAPMEDAPTATEPVVPTEEVAAPTEEAPKEGFDVEPQLPEVSPEAAEEAIPATAPAKPNRRRMTRKERGEIPVRPKGGGRARWMKKETYEANKDKYDMVGEKTEERVARILELLVKEG